VDALYALGRYQEAAEAVQQALASNPGFAHIPEYKVGASGGWELQIPLKADMIVKGLEMHVLCFLLRLAVRVGRAAMASRLLKSCSFFRSSLSDWTIWRTV
jgi:hypothetical protein